jgi:hypothetical protein
MKNSEQSSTPSATPTKRFYRFNNLITLSYNVYHTIEAESYDAAVAQLMNIDNVDDFDFTDFVELYAPTFDWECQEVDEDGEDIVEDDDENPLDND